MWGDISLWFLSAFSWWVVRFSTFPMSIGHLYVFLKNKSLFISSAHFLILDCLFVLELDEFLIYFGCELLTEYIICQYSLSFGRLPCHFDDGSLWCAKLFSLIWSRLFLFAFLFLSFEVTFTKPSWTLMSENLLPFLPRSSWL